MRHRLCAPSRAVLSAGCRACWLTAAWWLASAASALAAEPLSVRVLENAADRIVITYQIDGFTKQLVAINGRQYTQIALGTESLRKQLGAPELPNICRSVIIPHDAEMALRVLKSEHYDIADIDVPPSKGFILRTVNPQDVPYTFGPAYDRDAFYPGELAGLREPYILRDHRGVVVEINPFRYNPVKRILRVYTKVVVELVPVGPGQVNALHGERAAQGYSLPFRRIYERHFINFEPDARYAPLDETGDLLIICYDAWLANVQPLVTHKNSRGISTTVVGVSTAGSTASAIKSYIQGIYNSSDLAFVLLVGDAAEVPTPSASGGSADPTYALLAGSDHYPDLLVGRFSAQSAAQVDTQVERTIEYENLPAQTEDWYWRGTGVASNQGPGDDGEYDDEHMDNIRDDLLAHGYTLVDQIYDPTGTDAQVSAALNAGRGIVNYCGHGSAYAWSSTGFNTGDVSALVNDNTLPFIFSVACVNGQFDGITCFAETWLRATHNGEPTGAVATYMSSINQSWNPPMCAQDAFVDLLVAQAYDSFGALCFAGSCQMMDEYGAGGEQMFDTWHVFGDPSLRVVDTTSALSIGLPYGLPEPLAPGQPTDITVQIIEGGESYVPGSGTLHYRYDGGTFLTSALVHDTGDLYLATLPPAGCSDNPEYYISAPGTVTGVVTNPANAPSEFYTATVGELAVYWEDSFDSNPGWTAEGDWAFGTPTSGGGEYGGPDPTGGYTGSNVYGYNLSGDYANDLPERHLTSTTINCTGLSGVRLKFWRWLGVEQPLYDHAYVRVSNNGSNWTTAWDNTSEIADTSWQEMDLDISAVADGQSTVYLRWTMGATDGGWRYCGWNIDDVQLVAFVCQEDTDGDNVPDAEDNCPFDHNPGQEDTDGDEVGDACDACPNEPARTEPEGAIEDNCADGVDNDCDGDTDGADPDCQGPACVCGDVNGSGGLVDLDDFALFANCFGLSGPMPPECEAEHFACSDLDGNGEITLEDFSSFALWFGMTSTSTPPACMP